MTKRQSDTAVRLQKLIKAGLNNEQIYNTMSVSETTLTRHRKILGIHAADPTRKPVLNYTQKPQFEKRPLPPAHPHVAESDFISPLTKEQLMRGKA